MTVLAVEYEGQSNAGPSPAIWGTCPFDLLLADPSRGKAFHDDFFNFDALTSATKLDYYIGYEDSGVAIAQVAGDTGVVLVDALDLDNDEGSFEWGGGMANFFPNGIATGTGKTQLWFEARVKITTLTRASMFIGLAEKGKAAADALVDDTGAIGDYDAVGFNILDGSASVDTSYRKSGSAQQSVTEDVHTVVADTWLKAGLRYNIEDELLEYFVDNVRVATLAVGGATLFPDGEALTALWANKVGADTTDSDPYIDWWRFAHLRA